MLFSVPVVLETAEALDLQTQSLGTVLESANPHTEPNKACMVRLF
jgi:hypothetical protein